MVIPCSSFIHFNICSPLKDRWSKGHLRLHQRPAGLKEAIQTWSQERLTRPWLVLCDQRALGECHGVPSGCMKQLWSPLMRAASAHRLQGRGRSRAPQLPAGPSLRDIWSEVPTVLISVFCVLQALLPQHANLLL